MTQASEPAERLPRLDTEGTPPNDGPSTPAGLAEAARYALAGRVAYDLLHKINNLLVGVVSGAGAAESLCTLSELRRVLGASANHGREIANLLKSFSRLFDVPDTEREPGGVDLTDVIDGALFLCRNRLIRGGFVVKRHDEELPPPRGDLGPMLRILLEVIYSAVDALPHGGTLELVGRHSAASVTLTVAASKVTPGRASNILAALRQAQSGCDCRLGSGGAPEAAYQLGLIAAQVAARQYGGELTAEMQASRRLSFTLTVPKWQESAGVR